MNVLIIHHLETVWANGFKRFGTTVELVAYNILEHLQNKSYDKVILTRFEDNKLEDFHYEFGFSEFINEVCEYAYGWEKDMFAKKSEFCKGGSHSEVVWLAPFLKTLKKQKAIVDLCGAFDGECIEDMEIALDFLKIKYNRLNHLII